MTRDGAVDRQPHRGLKFFWKQSFSVVSKEGTNFIYSLPTDKAMYLFLLIWGVLKVIFVLVHFFHYGWFDEDNNDDKRFEKGFQNNKIGWSGWHQTVSSKVLTSSHYYNILCGCFKTLRSIATTASLRFLYYVIIIWKVEVNILQLSLT